jgi:hypothetical protein
VHVPPEEERGDDRHSRPDANTNTDALTMLAAWPEVYDSAERWVEWTARRRWPNFGANDQIWASSVASWELYGRAA